MKSFIFIPLIIGLLNSACNNRGTGRVAGSGNIVGEDTIPAWVDSDAPAPSDPEDHIIPPVQHTPPPYGDEVTNGQPQPRQQTSEEVAAARTLLIGTWVWEKTICCGRTPMEHSADTARQETLLIFRPDQSVEKRVGNTTQYMRDFQVRRGEIVRGHLEIMMGDGRAGMLSVSAEQLIIDYGYMDLQREFYRRQR